MLIAFRRAIKPHVKVLVESSKIVGVSQQLKVDNNGFGREMTILFVSVEKSMCQLFISETVDEAAAIIENCYAHTDRNEKRLDAIEQVLKEKVL